MHRTLKSLRRTLSVAALSVLGLTLLMPHAADAQQARFQIQGTVLGTETRAPLVGAQVTLRGTNQRTVTDQAGRFSLPASVPAGTYTLAVSYIGRGTQTRSVTLSAGQAGVILEPISLAPAAVSLGDVVGTAPGAQSERRALGNAVATVRAEAINNSPAAQGIGQALQGKVTGATITQTTGAPGGAMTIRLRGTSSINGSAEPLIVVDGVLIDNSTEALIGLNANAFGGGRTGSSMTGRLADIAPEDVERVEVLPGASAAALYGSRAKNGVILIFTKRGQEGRPRVEFSSDFSISQTPNRYELNNSPFAGHTDAVFLGKVLGDSVQRYDVQDFIFRNAQGSTNSLSVSGGNGGTNYYVSGQWNGGEGIIRNTGFSKQSARLKLSQQIGNRLNVTANANFIQSHTDLLPEGEQSQGVLTSAIFTPTTFDFNFNPNTGRYPYNPTLGPNALEIIENWEATEDVTRFIGNLEGALQLTDRLRARYLFGLDDYRLENKYYQPPASTSAAFTGSIQNPLRFARQYNHDLNMTHEYRRSQSFGLNSMIGFRYTANNDETNRLGATDLGPGIDIVSGATQTASQSFTEIRTIGGYLQEQLSLNDRLFVTGGANIEASSAFGEDVRWQLFPRIGASYVVSDAPWYGTSMFNNVFSSLRLRSAYGQTGGQPPSAYARFDNFTNISYGGRPGFVTSTVAGNPDLKPERQQEIEAGIDVGMLQERANLELTYYNRTTSDLVLNVPLPLSSGSSSQPQNIGEIGGWGVEAAINTINMNRDRFKWTSRLSLSHEESKVKELVTSADTLTFGYLNAVIEGQPLGVFYGGQYERNPDGSIFYSDVVVAGRTLSLPMRARVRRPDGTYNIAGTPINGVIGNPNPSLTAQFSNSFNVGSRIQMNVLFDGRFGMDVANFSRRIEELFGAGKAAEAEIAGDTVFRTFSLNPAGRSLIYEEYIEDASFVKLREVSLSYALSDRIANFVGASGASVRLAGRNLHTWTSYSGLDPEVNLFGASPVAQGVEFANTPVPRSFVLGINLRM